MVLEKVSSPVDLKKLTHGELKDLAQEIRDLIIERVSINGGHLGANLGVVELSIALHRVFNSPVDKIIWDVGHQSYTHKLLTGRAGIFHTLRQYGGMSGFPKRDENIHDVFGTGHSSTSISAALGISEAGVLQKKDFRAVAVIGDGAMTAGLAFEGLNHAGHLKRNLIIVLNDNEMSISPNVGALSAYLSRLITGEFVSKFKKEVNEVLHTIPAFGDPMIKWVKKAEEAVKCLFVPGMLFEELGFEYIGPVDGHSMNSLIETFERARKITGPVLVHAITKKGKGYKIAERKPELFHGVGPFDIETGTPASSSGRTFSEVFGSELVRLAEKDERIVAITAAMSEGTGLSAFKKVLPERCYDVGIAEPHAVTFAAGLASQGLRPVVAVYSTFLQRSYDEIIHDVCLQHLPVIFAIDRAGIVGDDGPTHNGTFDISYLRHIPHLVLMAPKNGAELKGMLKASLQYDGPVAIRYPRGKTSPESLAQKEPQITIGKSEILTEGEDIVILAIGSMVEPAFEAARILKSEADVSASVVNARFVKPLDELLIKRLARQTPLILTVEENALEGGFGSAVLEYLSDQNIPGLTIKRLGIPDRFIEQGRQSLIRKKLFLDANGVALKAHDMITKARKGKHKILDKELEPFVR